MEEDIRDVIQRKIWTVDNLISQVNDLITKAKNLPDDAKKNIPVFPSDWSEQGVTEFFEKLKESIKNPLRHKNRKLLEDRGIQTKGISEGVFEDFTGIQDVVTLFDKIKEFNETIPNILIGKDILVKWLKEGLDKTKENLREILNAKAGFERIFNSGINEKLRDELIQRSIEKREYIVSAEDIISKVKFIIEYGISIQYTEGCFDDFLTNLENVYQKLKTLKDEYNIPKDEISTLLNGKPLQDADKLLERKQKDCSEKKISLLEEWKMYSATLKAIGYNGAEPPRGLQELEEGVKKLKTECMSKLGKNGLSLIKFLKGEGDYPYGISEDEIKRVLEVLRPIFIKFLKEES